jgi:hypothetical protein
MRKKFLLHFEKAVAYYNDLNVCEKKKCTLTREHERQALSWCRSLGMVSDIVGAIFKCRRRVKDDRSGFLPNFKISRFQLKQKLDELVGVDEGKLLELCNFDPTRRLVLL